MTFGVIMMGEGRRAKIRCSCDGLTKPKVSMRGDKINKMRCAVAILAEVAREMFPGDVVAQRYVIQSLMHDAEAEIMRKGKRKRSRQ